MKVLFHCHTKVSPCSNIKEHDLVDFLDKNNFDAVAVTDHDTLTLIDWPRGVVIPASEITSSEGDVIGVFLKKAVPEGLSIKETSRQIRAQGGVVVAPHPSDKLRREAMGTKTLLKNLEYFDIIEEYNSRNLFDKSNRQAAEIAKKHKIPVITGSDAHTLGELPNTHMEMPAFSTPKEFIQSLQKTTSQRKPSGPVPHVKTVLIKLAKKIERRRKRQQ